MHQFCHNFNSFKELLLSCTSGWPKDTELIVQCSPKMGLRGVGLGKSPNETKKKKKERKKERRRKKKESIHQVWEEGSVAQQLRRWTVNRRIAGSNPPRTGPLELSWLFVPLSKPGGFSHWHGIRICACLLGHFFAKFGIAIGGFSSETKEPKLHKLGVFWANYCKKHPIWSKLGAFLSKMVYWWVGNLAKNWYRDSQIFKVRQAHPHTILVKEPPPPVSKALPSTCLVLRRAL